MAIYGRRPISGWVLDTGLPAVRFFSSVRQSRYNEGICNTGVRLRLLLWQVHRKIRVECCLLMLGLVTRERLRHRESELNPVSSDEWRTRTIAVEPSIKLQIWSTFLLFYSGAFILSTIDTSRIEYALSVARLILWTISKQDKEQSEKERKKRENKKNRKVHYSAQIITNNSVRHGRR